MSTLNDMQNVAQVQRALMYVCTYMQSSACCCVLMCATHPLAYKMTPPVALSPVLSGCWIRLHSVVFSSTFPEVDCVCTEHVPRLALTFLKEKPISIMHFQ